VRRLNEIDGRTIKLLGKEVIGPDGRKVGEIVGYSMDELGSVTRVVLETERGTKYILQGDSMYLTEKGDVVYVDLLSDLRVAAMKLTSAVTRILRVLNSPDPRLIEADVKEILWLIDSARERLERLQGGEK